MKFILVKMADDFAPNGERIRLHVGTNEEIDKLKNSILRFNFGKSNEIIEEKEFNDLALLIEQDFTKVKQ